MWGSTTEEETLGSLLVLKVVVTLIREKSKIDHLETGVIRSRENPGSLRNIQQYNRLVIYHFKYLSLLYSFSLMLSSISLPCWSHLIGIATNRIHITKYQIKGILICPMIW